ncbi:kinase-like protein [Rhizopogon vinicolor AM-OR11-026]|uniref:Kinase-like protein n=1 Tax=Rhizopogon vinicolor AM-OR11-026 TaxID=1314800 RepID=A0A1B7NFP9_9AGAM|nr:kinase-like protein [Rhizopogon vinicolor AM-OR11-026]
MSLSQESVSTPARFSGCAAANVAWPTSASTEVSVPSILPPVASGTPNSVVGETEALQGSTDAGNESAVQRIKSILDYIDALLAKDRAMNVVRMGLIHAPDRMNHAAVPRRRNATGPIVFNTPTPTRSLGRVKLRYPFRSEMCLSDFIVRAKLGAGTFGVVYRVEDKITSHIMALKVIKKHGETFKQCRVELDAMKRLMGDPHCVQVEAGFQDEQCLYLALAFYPGGDLDNLLRTYQGQSLPVDHARRFTAELLVGVHHLHRQGIIHRDLKPSNILIDSQGHLVISDLGMAKVFPLKDPDWFSPYNPTGTFASLSQAPYLTNLCCGTVKYMAPEIILDIEYGFAVDFWAVGVMLYEMLMGRAPWIRDNDPSMAATASAIVELEPDFVYDFDPEAKDLLRRMLHKHVQCRPLYEPMLHHPFFASIDWQQVEKRSLPPVRVPVVREQDNSSIHPISLGKCRPSSDPLPNFNFISPTLKRQRRQAQSHWRMKAKKSMQGLQKVAAKIFSRRPTSEMRRSATTLVGNDNMRRDSPLDEYVHESFIDDIAKEKPRPTPNNVRVTPSPSPAAISSGATLVGSATHQSPKKVRLSPSSGFKRWIHRLLHPVPVIHVLVGDERKTLDLTA